ncbi:helix-turn-helix domain-containing protein [archaeon]|nr:helix-turn-helix domain-containing protein [archaeon]
MWVAKIKFSAKETLIGSKISKYNLNILGFPLSYYYQKNHIITHITGVILGKDEDKKTFLKKFKKEKRVINFELNGDFFVGTIKEPLFAKCVYNKNIIHIAPALITDKGYEIITIGCFKKEPLIKAYHSLKKYREGELLFIQQKKVKSISIIKLHPDLTEKQKRAIELAIKKGYYYSPRKIDLQKLAKLSGLSFSTYQVHLRKAEEKLIPYFFE